MEQRQRQPQRHKTQSKHQSIEKNTRAIHDKQSNRIIIYLIWCVQCTHYVAEKWCFVVVLREKYVASQVSTEFRALRSLKSREANRNNAPSNSSHRATDQKIKTKWGKHVNKQEIFLGKTTTATMMSCANTKSIELRSTELSWAERRERVILLWSPLDLVPYRFSFCRKLFVLNGYYYYGFFISSLALNSWKRFLFIFDGRSFACWVLARAVTISIENVNWLPSKQNKCNNSPINIKNIVDDKQTNGINLRLHLTDGWVLVGRYRKCVISWAWQSINGWSSRCLLCIKTVFSESRSRLEFSWIIASNPRNGKRMRGFRIE